MARLCRLGCGQTLPRYKVPDAFYQWPATDPNSFKIDRARFRRLALEGPKTPLVSTNFSSRTASQPTEGPGGGA